MPQSLFQPVGNARFAPAGPSRKQAAPDFRIPAAWLACLVLGLGCLTARAQQDTASSTTPTEIVAPPQPPLELPAVGTQVLSSAPQAVGAPAQPTPFQWGPFAARPHILYRLLRGNGLQSSPGDKETTTINSIVPGILFSLGDHWTLDYTADKTFYTNPKFEDTLNHSVLLTGTTAEEGWSLKLIQTYDSTTAPLVETGRQTTQHTYLTNVGVTEDLGSDMQLELTASQDARMVEGSPDSRDWATSDWLHLRWMPALDTAAGVKAGYVEVKPGPNMTYLQPQLRMDWRATAKTTLDLQGGLEHRTFNSSGSGSINTTTFSVSLQNRPFEPTQVTVQGGRDVSASYFTNEITTTTRIGASVDQRLLGEFHLNVAYARQKSRYASTRSTIVISRNDTYDSLNLRLSTVLFRRMSIATLYQVARNDSNAMGYGFTTHQIGLELGYRF